MDDPAERQAETVAARAPLGQVIPSIEGQRPRPVERVIADAGELAREALGSPGRELDAATRRRFSHSFGEDFSHVRVHTGSAAEESAKSLNALAYTFGRHIVFGRDRYAPNSTEGRRLIAHELAHVVQQQAGPPVIQRAPDRTRSDPPRRGKATSRTDAPDPKYPLFKPADQVIELTRGAGDDWELVISGHITEESVSRVIWPNVRPPWVRITFKVAAVDPVVIGIFRLEGVSLTALQVMEPSIAKLFVDRGLVDESVESDAEKEARQRFRRRHADLGDWRLSAINAALRQATRRNRNLLVAWYRYYAEHGFEREEMSRLGETVSGDTSINEDVLMLRSKFPTNDPLSLLGSTLIHEFVHTPHGGADTIVGSARSEAKAYGIELFFAERMGDKKREQVISRRYNKNDPVDMRMGGDRIFNESYYIMKQLYKIIDQGGPAAEEARMMSVEFISRNEDKYGPELKAFVSKHR